MAKDKIPYHQLPEDACLNEQQLYGYMDGTLSYKEQHAVEEHLLDCNFCSDALAGFELVKDRSKIAALPLVAAVQPQNGEPVARKKEKGRVIPFYRSPRSYAAAAALILVLAVTWYFKGLTGSDANKQLSDNTTTKQEAPAAEKDAAAMADSMTVTDGNAQRQEQQQNKEQPEKTETINTGNLAETSPVPADAANTKFRQESGPGAERADKEAEKMPVSGKKAAPGERAVDGDFIAAEEASVTKDEQKKELLREQDYRAADKNTNPDIVTNGAVIATDSIKSTIAFASPVTLNQATGASTYLWTTPDSLSVRNNTVVSSPTFTTTSGVHEVSTVSAKKNNSFLFSKNDAYKKSKSSKPMPTAASETQSSSPQTDNEKYNRALAEINGGRNESALLILNDLLKNPASPLYPDAQWQKAVVLLKLNKKAEARTILQEIVKKGGKYKPLAESQLKQL